MTGPDKPSHAPGTSGVSRRTFLASAVAAPAVMGALGVQRSAWGAAGGDDRLRIGLIGCGGRGTGAAVQALTADSGATLHAMGDLFPDRLEGSLKGLTDHFGDGAADRLQVPGERRFTGLDAYKRVIDSGVDVVILTTTPNFRPVHLRAAIEAGKHVFAEKPVAVDAPGYRSVVESAAMARAKNLAIQIGFCWRYADAERATFAKINQGGIGEVVSVHTTYHTGTLSARPRQAAWSDLEWQMRNWWHFTWISGDHIVEQAVHSIDKLAWALGDVMPVRATCLGGRAARSGPESGHVFDHFAVVYEYANGRRAFHTCRQIDGCPSDNSDYIYGSAGSAEVNGWTPTHVLRDLRGKATWSYDGPRNDMYQNEHDELFASIRNGQPINDAQRGANSTLMAIMGRMAAYTGRTISWEEAAASTEDLTPPVLDFGAAMPVPPVAIPGKTKFM